MIASPMQQAKRNYVPILCTLIFLKNDFQLYVTRFKSKIITVGGPLDIFYNTRPFKIAYILIQVTNPMIELFCVTLILAKK